MGANPRMQPPFKEENTVYLHQTRLAVMLSIAIATGASAQDWPQFRGLGGGVAEDTRSLPDLEPRQQRRLEVGLPDERGVLPSSPATTF